MSVLNQIMEAFGSKPTPPPVASAHPSPTAVTAGIMAAFAKNADDPTIPFVQDDSMNTTAVLKLIGDKEAPLGYNQMYGETKLSTDLTKMTVADVQKLQAERKKAGVKSTAVGRYQFLQGTLGKLVQKGVVKATDKFDAAAQDKLAVALLRRRGLDKYLAGQLDSAAFANELAKEWASLPVVSGDKKGRSYYDGDGLNKALIQPADILKALQE